MIKQKVIKVLSNERPGFESTTLISQILIQNLTLFACIMWIILYIVLT